jgi:hypothetical protein
VGNWVSYSMSRSFSFDLLVRFVGTCFLSFFLSSGSFEPTFNS